MIISRAFEEWVKGKVVAVDFDGTLAETEYPRILFGNDNVINMVKWLKENGATIVLWTCREEKELDEALSWCKLNGIPIDYANENVPERIKLFGTDCRKIGYDLILDDKSISFSELEKIILGE